MSDRMVLENPTFRQWLAYAAKGSNVKAWHDLNDWFAHSCPCDTRARTIFGVIQHARTHDDLERPPLGYFRAAFREYTAFMRAGGEIPKKIGPPKLPPDLRKVRTSYALPQSSLSMIEKLCDRWGVRSRAEVVRISIEIAAARNPKRAPRAVLAARTLKQAVQNRVDPS